MSTPGVSLTFLEWFCGADLGIRNTLETYPPRPHGAIPEDFTVYDVCRQYVLPYTRDRGVSLIEQLRQDKLGSAVLGPWGRVDCEVPFWSDRATCFVSYVWSYPFLDVVRQLTRFARTLSSRALDDRFGIWGPDVYPSDQGPFFWIDLFCVDQHGAGHARDWWLRTFRESIPEIGHSVFLMHPPTRPALLSRSWCLYEMFATTMSRTKMTVLLGHEELDAAVQASSGDLIEAIKAIDISNASATVDEDGRAILRVVEEDVGIAQLSSTVRVRLLGVLLGSATRLQDRDLILALLEQGATLDFTGTELHAVALAVWHGKDRALRTLLECGMQADVDAIVPTTDYLLKTPSIPLLSMAVLRDHVHIVDILLNEAHVRREAADSTGRSALHILCELRPPTQESSIRMAELLVADAAGALLQVDSKGRTPLHYACDAACVHMILGVPYNDDPGIAAGVLDVLLAQGTAASALEVRDDSGCTPVQYARRQAEESERGADTSSQLREDKKRLERCSVLEAYCADRKRGFA